MARSAYFLSDALYAGRRYRILKIVDDVNCEVMRSVLIPRSHQSV